MQEGCGVDWLTCKDLLGLQALVVSDSLEALQLGDAAVLHPHAANTHCSRASSRGPGTIKATAVAAAGKEEKEDLSESLERAHDFKQMMCCAVLCCAGTCLAASGSPDPSRSQQAQQHNAANLQDASCCKLPKSVLPAFTWHCWLRNCAKLLQRQDQVLVLRVHLVPVTPSGTYSQLHAANAYLADFNAKGEDKRALTHTWLHEASVAVGVSTHGVGNKAFHCCLCSRVVHGVPSWLRPVGRPSAGQEPCRNSRCEQDCCEHCSVIHAHHG
jgi:hypothetical protein